MAETIIVTYEQNIIIADKVHFGPTTVICISTWNRASLALKKKTLLSPSIVKAMQNERQLYS